MIIGCDFTCLDFFELNENIDGTYNGGIKYRKNKEKHPK